ncbi:MAG: ABC transporter ATP-binding protein [Flavobacterium sp.]|nr:MAG: ABC transporter ATP-binding protein [Flavobacterium sp.]
MLDVRDISFSYSGKPAVSSVSFKLEAGKHLALLGESGSGKSTLLKLLYGIYDLDSGSISFDETSILGPKFNLIAGDDRFRYLAQDFGLMPFSTAAENVGSFLSNINITKKRDRIEELLDLVDMTDFAQVKPKNLSGGQQQRIALAKALASEPKLMLLDEPFSQIDSFRSKNLKRRLFHYFREKDIACIVATHEGDDALAFADEILILKDGQTLQKGIPKHIFQNPETIYVASLFGEAMQIPMRHFNAESRGEVIVYAHQLRISQSGLRAIVRSSYFHGDHYTIEASYTDGILWFRNSVPIMNGQGVFLSLMK